MENNKLDSYLRVNIDQTEDIGNTTNFKDKPFTGTCFDIYPNNGLQDECDFVNGLKHGFFKQYSESGYLVSNHTYLNDKLNGFCVDYDDKGEIFEIKLYENDIPVLNFTKKNKRQKLKELRKDEKQKLEKLNNNNNPREYQRLIEQLESRNNGRIINFIFYSLMILNTLFIGYTNQGHYVYYLVLGIFIYFFKVDKRYKPKL
tara:strand:+ start:70 stop:675 length:606 start_codon:yes stop_codon:yes gene_type:complete